MQLHERYRNFPIQFYQYEDGHVEYESAFTLGKAKSLEDAFKKLSKEDFTRDLLFYFDDVADVMIGKFIPSLTDKVRKGRKYLGKIEVQLDIDDHNGYNDPNKSVTNLQKNKEALKSHLKWMNKMKREEKFDKIKNNIVKGFKNLISQIKGEGPIYEMFQPRKSNKQMICEHCGRVIPIATYFDRWENKDYHIECIWDKLVNNQEMNSYESAEKFFWSLQAKVGNWPGYGFDVEEDYLSDCELVKHNNRVIRRTPMEESIKSLNETFEYYRK